MLLSVVRNINRLKKLFNKSTKISSISRFSSRHHHLAAGIPFASLLLFNLDKSYAEDNNILQTSSNSIKNEIKVKEKATVLLKSIIDALRALWSFLKDFFRITQVTLLLSPALLLSPIALFGGSLEDWWWSVLRSCVCYCGPCFIKFGQWAATRTDLFPAHLCKEMGKLQANVSPHSWKYTRRMLSKAMGENWEDLLTLPSESALGCGCVAQVHRGYIELPVEEERVTEGSRRKVPVVVKVLHPGVKEVMKGDLQLFYDVSVLLERIGGFLLGFLPSAGGVKVSKDGQKYPLVCVSLRESVELFRDLLNSQMDLTVEADAMDRFRLNFNGRNWNKLVKFPKTYELLEDTTSDRYSIEWRERVLRGFDGKNSEQPVGFSQIIPHPEVIVESFHEGRLLTDVLVDLNYPVDRSALAKLGLDMILKMIFEDNFIHADLHAGNLLLEKTTDANGKETLSLVVLDPGLTTNLTKKDRWNFVALFKAVLDNDGAKVARLIMNEQNESYIIDPQGYEEAVKGLVAHVHARGLSLKELSVSVLIQRLLQASYQHRVRLDSQFVAVVLAVALAEGMGRQLDPSIDLLARASPYIASAALHLAIDLRQ